jgi:tetratricopeptide (TPR) repeat protein
MTRRLLPFPLVHGTTQHCRTIEAANFEAVSDAGLLHQFILRRCLAIQTKDEHETMGGGGSVPAFDFENLCNQAATTFSAVMHTAKLSAGVAAAALELSLKPPVVVSHATIVSVIQKLRQQFLGKLGCAEVEVACMKAAIQLENVELTNSLVESVLDNHHTKTFVLDADTVNQFHHLFWSKAAEFYNSRNLSNAVRIYSYSLSFPIDDLATEDISNLNANAAWCYLKLDDIELAKQHSNASIENLRSRYVVFKLAIDAGDAGTAVQMVQSIGSEQPDPTNELREGLLCLAVTEAYEQQNRAVAVEALTKLCCDDVKVNDTHLLRCLLRLKHTEFQPHDFREKWNELLELVVMAAQKIKHIESAHISETEREWWARMAWQFGIEACNTEIQPAAVGFLQACADLDSLAQTSNNSERRKLCMVLVSDRNGVLEK